MGHHLHKAQVKDFLKPAIDRIFIQNGLRNDMTTELPILESVAKPQEIITRLELWEQRAAEQHAAAEPSSPYIPQMPKPSSENVFQTAQNNLNLALMRVLMARENAAQGVGIADPQELDRLLPGLVKKWQGKGIGNAVTDHFQVCAKQDIELENKQFEHLKTLSAKVKQCEQEVKVCEKNMPKLREAYAAANVKLVEKLERYDTSAFLQHLESLYHGDDNNHALSAKKTLALTYKLTGDGQKALTGRARKILGKS